MIRDWSKYAPYFTELELDCRHCGKNEMQPQFMDALLKVRKLYARPMVVSSGYRCPDHNDRISSTGRNGPHTTGLAADILCSGTEARVLLELLTYEFPRIGISQKGDHSSRFLHADLLNKPAWIWTY